MKVTTAQEDYFLQSVDQLAKRQEVARSRLIELALEDYLLKHGCHEWVTESLNRVYATEDSGVDPVLAALQWRTLAGFPGNR